MIKWSAFWGSSKDPSKQRKFRYNAPKHVRARFMSAHLSKVLRAQHKTRSMELRVGDTVKVLRGSHKGKSGEISMMDMKNYKVQVAGVESTKRDGSKSFIPQDPSNLLITSLKSDKRRFAQ